MEQDVPADGKFQAEAFIQQWDVCSSVTASQQSPAGLGPSACRNPIGFTGCTIFYAVRDVQPQSVGHKTGRHYRRVLDAI